MKFPIKEIQKTMRTGKKILLLLTIAVLTICVLGSAAADVKPIPLDMLEHGTPPKKSGWITPAKEYQDESIHVVLNERRHYKSKTSDGNITIRWVVIEIKDPSQLRTVLSNDSYENKKGATSQEMVEHVNPVVAINDDYVKINNFKGYVVRQGVFYSDTLDEWKEEMKQDVLIIDSEGDFTVVSKASSAEVKECIAGLEADGKSAVNVFTFGPALVLNGQVQEIKRNDSTHEVILATARTVICQLDTLTYAVFAADSIKNGYGINCTEFANFIVKTFPDCKVAYNLDGGASSRLYMGQKRVNTAKGRREIYGMVYFASAASED